ncbi:MAG: malate/lactate/ureidoglycolate dehydrogenase [SAR324 cluster bacterium]|nr:malate/lactate/ureidoglycolate dehydrogenase [SAR324 cluster bacterium]
MLIHADPLKQLVIAILQSGGSSETEAEIVSDHLVLANLSGHDSHGVGMLPMYFERLHKGLLHPNQHPELVKEDGSILVFDGKSGYGHVVAREATAQAIEHCKQSGLVLMALRNSQHISRVGTYGEQAVAAGLVSLSFVNVTDHHPLVAPFGGSDARFSTNPLCFAIPGTDQQPPIILDMATSQVALGKVRVAINKEEQVPENWLIDHTGQSTRNPRVMEGYLFPKEDSPPLGALMPLGAYKGYGLALFCEMLAGILTGHGTIQPGNPREGSIVNNMLSILFDPSRLVDQSWMHREMEALVEYFKASPPADPSNPVKVAGDPERAMREKRGAEGIPIDGNTWEQIMGCGEMYGLSRSEMHSIAGIS